MKSTAAVILCLASVVLAVIVTLCLTGGANKTVLQTAYYPSGKIRSIFQYKDGVREGTQVEYFENGRVEKEYFCTSGMLNGLYVRWSDAGKVLSAVVFQHGILEEKNIRLTTEKLLNDLGTGRTNGYPLKYGRL